jgi:hypothetical protein
VNFPARVAEEGRKFAEDTLKARQEATERLLRGEVLEIDPDPALRQAIADAVGVDAAVAASIARGESLDALGLSADQKVKAQQVKARVIDNSEPLAFVDEALQAAYAVGRLVNGGTNTQGTCFMISPRLLATAGHVLEEAGDLSKLRVEFKFDAFFGRDPVHTEFELKPDLLLLLPKDLGGLDVAVVAIGPRIGTSTFNPSFCSLTDGGRSHQISNHANIIHYPRGVPQLVVRDNWLVLRDDIQLSYRSQTDTASSGAPVFNAAWKPIALHVWGETRPDPLIQIGDRILIPDEVNRGIRTHVIHQKLRLVAATKTGGVKGMIDEAAPP